MCKRHVSNDPFSKESADAILRTVEKLIGDQEFSRAQVFRQGTDSAYGDDALYAQELHGVDVGAVIDLAWQDAVAPAVARQKRHALSF